MITVSHAPDKRSDAEAGAGDTHRKAVHYCALSRLTVAQQDAAQGTHAKMTAPAKMMARKIRPLFTHLTL